MSDPRDYKLDLSTAGEAPSSSPAAGRPFLSVTFACCNVYARIYRSPDATHYSGRCPRCGKPVRFLVRQDGTSARNFTVY
jgi:hypothetical protein